MASTDGVDHRIPAVGFTVLAVVGLVVTYMLANSAYTVGTSPAWPGRDKAMTQSYWLLIIAAVAGGLMTAVAAGYAIASFRK